MKCSKTFDQPQSDNKIFDKVVEERKTVGYYQLPYADVSELKTYAKSISKKHIMVVGVGGSSLGSKAIYEFLLSSSKHLKDLVFLDTVDPLYIKRTLEKVDLNDTHFIIISKSGTTVEVVSLLMYINSIIKINSRNSSIVSETSSSLTRYANLKNIRVFSIAQNVGGRFSVFSAVGLLPLAMIGVDIDALLKGCRDVSNSFFGRAKCYDLVMKKAKAIVENKAQFHTNVVFSYLSGLRGFNQWYIQLWAESLGKININGSRQGLTPVGLIGPGDQHSYLQLVVDGVRDKTVTFIKVSDLNDASKIPMDLISEFEEIGINYTEGIFFNDLINKQADATIASVHAKGDVPYDVILMSSVNELNIGALMYMYQLLTSCIGVSLQVSTYDQPGVEVGKMNLKVSLSAGTSGSSVRSFENMFDFSDI
jgi:glucose-6-phosphate isomerase